MQRAKHADRKQRTRALILIGAAADRAGAAHLDPAEIEAVLAHYVATGGEHALRTAVARHLETIRLSSEAKTRASSDRNHMYERDNPLREPAQ